MFERSDRNKNLLSYLDLLKIIHKKNDFFVFDKNWDLVTANQILCNFSNLKFYYSPLDSIISWNDYITSLKSMNMLNTLNDLTEIIGFHEYSFNSQLQVTPLLFSINKIYDNNEVIGFFLVYQGNVKNFEFTNILKYAIFDDIKEDAHHVPTKITPRESEILFYLARGFGYSEIAVKLSKLFHKGISHKTVGNMVRESLYTKFKVFNLGGLRKVILKTNLSGNLPPSIYRCYRH